MQGALPGFRAARGQSPHVHPAPRKRNSPVGAESLPGACWPEDQEALLSAISASSTPAVAACFRVFKGRLKKKLFVSICFKILLVAHSCFSGPLAPGLLCGADCQWAALSTESLKVCFFPSTPTACTPTLRSPSRQAWEDWGKSLEPYCLVGACQYVPICASDSERFWAYLRMFRLL